MVRKDVCIRQPNVKKFTSFEHNEIIIKKREGSILRIIVFYRLLYISLNIFFIEFRTLLEFLSLSSSNFIIGGDVNLHCDLPTNVNTVTFYDMLHEFNLSQFINFPTHNKGHTLDVLLANSDSTHPMNITCVLSDLSDHYPITFDLSGNTTKIDYIDRLFRVIDSIDKTKFQNDITDSLVDLPTNSFSEAIKLFDCKLSNILNVHAPLKSKRIRIILSSPWFDGEYEQLRRERRSAEKKWRKTRLQIHHEIYIQKRKITNLAATNKKRSYYADKAKSCINNQKQLFDLFNAYHNKVSASTLPAADSDFTLAENFNSFFIDKIRGLRENIIRYDNNIKINLNSTNEKRFSGCPMSTFDMVNENQLREIIGKTGIKCSRSDPLPSNVMTDNIDVLLPYICTLVNLSLMNGTVEGAKLADIIPVLKKQGTDPECMKNYRPISNLKFIGKLIERVVLKQLNAHMDKNKLHISYQSGYKKSHGTESLLLKITNDIYVASDDNKATVLILLDLSAAFDTIDHSKLIDILSRDIGLSGVVMKWFISFITGRQQRVCVNNTYSKCIDVDFGVPQGSVLGPVLFNIYLRSFYSIIIDNGFNVAGYADDHQIYKHFTCNSQYITLTEDIKRCLYDIHNWMCDYFLKLNPRKTEIILLGSKIIVNQIGINGINLPDGTCIRFTSKVKNLGCIIDQHLDFNSHIQSIISSCFNTIRHIAKIKHFLTNDLIRTLVISLVINRLDNNNSLLYGIKGKLLQKLQNVQNCCARLIYRRSKKDHVTDIFHELHWLHVRERIIFKILLIVYKCLHNDAPSYLKDLVVVLRPNYRLLDVPGICGSLGRRSFAYCGPKLWNCVPVNIRKIDSINVFKGQLKHMLFTNSHGFYERFHMS